MADLIVGLGDMLPIIEAQDIDIDRVEGLKHTIIDMLKLVDDASRFVLKYKSNGVAGVVDYLIFPIQRHYAKYLTTTVSALNAFACSNARDQVDEFLKRFKRFRGNFDRGMLGQVAEGMNVLLNDGGSEILHQRA